MQATSLIAGAGVLLIAKIWYDISEMIKQHLRMQYYLKLSACALDVVKVVREESYAKYSSNSVSPSRNYDK